MTPRLVVSCEHASCEVPEQVALQLAPEVLRSHHAWDLGAADLAKSLAGAFGAPLLLGTVSRLVVDLNRAEENPEVVPVTSSGLPVPGNADLPPSERERRLGSYHRPYREAARLAVGAIASGGDRCLHLSVHSFVPVLDGRRRELEVGILFDPDRSWELELAEALLSGLRARGWDARANEPYLGIDDGLTTWLRRQHADSSYAGLEVEASQGLLEAPGRLTRLAADLTEVTAEILGRGVEFT